MPLASQTMPTKIRIAASPLAAAPGSRPTLAVPAVSVAMTALLHVGGSAGPFPRGPGPAPAVRRRDRGGGLAGVWALGQLARGERGGEVLDPVQVARGWQEPDLEPGASRPFQGRPQHRAGAHGHPGEQLRRWPLGPDQVVAAVERRPQRHVGLVEQREARLVDLDRQVRGVRGDDRDLRRPAADQLLQAGGEPLAEATAALRQQAEAGREPGHPRARPRRREAQPRVGVDAGDGPDRVAQHGAGGAGGALRSERGRQPRLGLAGGRLLGDHGERASAAPGGPPGASRVGAARGSHPSRPRRSAVSRQATPDSTLQASASTRFSSIASVDIAPGSRAPPTREPTTRSASPRSTGPAIRSRSAPSNEPSASANATTSACGEATTPAQQAAPKPRRGSRTTRAPAAAATSAVPSVEPLSTTSRSSPGWKEASAAGRASASSRAGRMTVTRLGSMVGSSLLHGSDVTRSGTFRTRDGSPPRLRRGSLAR